MHRRWGRQQEPANGHCVAVVGFVCFYLKRKARARMIIKKGAEGLQYNWVTVNLEWWEGPCSEKSRSWLLMMTRLF